MLYHLTDNDVILKFAAWNLLPEAVAALEATPSDVCVLPTLITQLQKNKAAWVNRYGAATLARALHFVQSVTVLNAVGTGSGELAELVLLNEVDDLDEGEAILFTATRNRPGFRVITGDKRCLPALHGAETCRHIETRVRGNVVHLEQIVLLVLDKRGLSFVREAVRRCPDADIAVRNAFGMRWDHSADTVRTRLQASIRQLHTDCGNLLHDPPTDFFA